MSDLTIEQVKEALPTGYKLVVQQSLVDKINQICKDPDLAERVRENFITYAHVLHNPRIGMDEYLHAVTYVSYKSAGLSNQESYFRTFPDRKARLMARGTPAKDIACYVSAYHRSKVVTSLLDQMYIPVWLVNQDAYQEAINTQVDIMRNGRSEKARVAAADSILNHLKKPEKIEQTLNIDVNETQSLKDLKDSLAQLAQAQIASIKNGSSPKEIAEQDIIDVE